MTKTKKILYWLTTALVSFGMLGSGISQILQTKEMLEFVTPLGYPPYFFIIIGIWKVLAVITILLPGFKLVKEWAYAGLFFTMTGALISHLACGDSEIGQLIGPIMQTIFIVCSWYLRPEDRKIKIN